MKAVTDFVVAFDRLFIMARIDRELSVLLFPVPAGMFKFQGEHVAPVEIRAKAWTGANAEGRRWIRTRFLIGATLHVNRIGLKLDDSTGLIQRLVNVPIFVAGALQQHEFGEPMA